MSAAEAKATKVLRADARRNQDRIVEIAEELFTRHGKDVQMKQIAERAGVGVATVYRVFASKDAMVGAIAARRFERCLTAAEETLEKDGAAAALREFLRRLAAVFQGSGAELRSLLSELPADQRPTKQSDLVPRLVALHGTWTADGALRPALTVEDLRAVICGLTTSVACGLDADLATDVFQAGITA
ncbi:TetR/AcrR family transcriptional regulator [Streptomyces sp. NPDC053560]|uniref:TetR/AcrR family transcriptional regulator n=1 Tax=Streptomyces sp. NPDC053560 TaxID=3365711 RepID=UPI0037D24C1E